MTIWLMVGSALPQEDLTLGAFFQRFSMISLFPAHPTLTCSCWEQDRYLAWEYIETHRILGSKFSSKQAQPSHCNRWRGPRSVGHWHSLALPSLSSDTCGCWAVVLQGFSFPAVPGMCFWFLMGNCTLDAQLKLCSWRGPGEPLCHT